MTASETNGDLKTFARWMMRGFLALPFALPGFALLAYGDTSGRPWMVALGVVLFLVGFAWLAFCTLRGGVSRLLGPGSAGAEVQRATVRRAVVGMPFFVGGALLTQAQDSRGMQVVAALLIALGFGWFAFCCMKGALEQMETLGVRFRPRPSTSAAIVAVLMGAFAGSGTAVGGTPALVLWGVGAAAMLLLGIGMIVQIRAAARDA